MPSLLLETRAALDVAKMIKPLIGSRLRRQSLRDDVHVIVVPGFGSDDKYTVPLRGFLKHKGFRAEGWGMGINRAGVNLPHSLEDLSERWQVDEKPEYNGEASVPYLCDQLTERVRERHEELLKPIVLIGWSLGGYLAREVARDLPNIVSRVITLGSPTVGGPKYTRAAKFFEDRGMDLDWIEEEIDKREATPIHQPITAIYSRSDAVVDWKAAIDRYSQNVRHIEVDASHLGMGFNPVIWDHILEALDGRAESAS